MKKLITNGLTVRQLKELIKDWPETYDNGEETEVWIEFAGGLSNQVKEVWPLNVRDNGVADIMLSY
jgi:hypothetical protein